MVVESGICKRLCFHEDQTAGGGRLAQSICVWQGLIKNLTWIAEMKVAIIGLYQFDLLLIVTIVWLINESLNWGGSCELSFQATSVSNTVQFSVHVTIHVAYSPGTTVEIHNRANYEFIHRCSNAPSVIVRGQPECKHEHLNNSGWQDDKAVSTQSLYELSQCTMEIILM